MDNKRKLSNKNESVIDEANSMYFSFNNSGTDCEDGDKTLEGEELIFDENQSTIRKASNPSIACVNLTNLKMHSSTPTKYFSPRPIYKRRDVSLGISLLPGDNSEQSENKENVTNESPCSKIISEMNVQLEKLKISNDNSNKKVFNKKNILDVLNGENILKESSIAITNKIENKFQLNGNENVSKHLPTLRKRFSNEPDLSKNRPSRISDKKSPTLSKKVKSPIISNTAEMNNLKVLNKIDIKRPEKCIHIDNLPNSIESSRLKIEKRRTIYATYTFPTRKSIVNCKSINLETNNSIKRQPRLSVSKTTLNSPGIIKNIRRTIPKPIMNYYKQESSAVSGSSLTLLPKHNSKQFRVQNDEINKKSSENKCKYCDKKFAIAKALDIHLLQNCLKIPAAAKKKLLINEHSLNTRKSMATLPIPTIAIHSSKTSISLSSNESVSSKSEIHSEADFMPPPSSTKVKKRIPHSGIYSTPTKLLSCPTCKRSFINVYDFSEHTLSHSHGE